MDILENVLTNLEAKRGQWDAIAKESGVGRSTVYRIGNRETENPTIGSLKKLHQYFDSVENASDHAA